MIDELVEKEINLHIVNRGSFDSSPGKFRNVDMVLILKTRLKRDKNLYYYDIRQEDDGDWTTLVFM